MNDGLGLLVENCNHIETLAGLSQIPVTFGVIPSDLPSEWVPPLAVESQGRTNSCVGHSEAIACAHANYVKTREVVRFSRWFAYITAQKAGGFFGRDQGTSVQSALVAATNTGCCLESDCPFPNDYNTSISSNAYTVAARHKHHGSTAYDCRDWDRMLQWITDRRSVIIGTKWYAGQDACKGVETRATSSGAFRGYHARTLVGWKTVSGMIVPVVQNSHGTQWGIGGRAPVTRDQWEFWRQDPNFAAFGYNEIDEVQPARRSWIESRPGDKC